MFHLKLGGGGGGKRDGGGERERGGSYELIEYCIVPHVVTVVGYVLCNGVYTYVVTMHTVVGYDLSPMLIAELSVLLCPLRLQSCLV